MPIHSSSESSLAGESSVPNCSYTSTPVQDKSKPNWKNEIATHSTESTETKVQGDGHSEKQVDVHNLWAQLLGAGLVSDPSTSANMVIPGLDSIATNSTKIENTDSIDQKEENNDKTKANKKKGKAQKENVKEESKSPKKKDKPSYKEIVLKSHHSSIKT